MITHVVMWKFLERAAGSAKGENLDRARRLLEAMKENIPEIDDLEVGVNVLPSEQANDLVLIARFKDRDALKRYQEHPVHQDAVRFLRQVHGGRVVVDFEEPA